MASVSRTTLAHSDPDAFSPESETLARLQAQRFSCRSFRPEPVADAVINRMLAIAQMSPSWCNTQPWQITITSGDATERVRKALLDHLDTETFPSQPDFAFPTAYSGVRRDRRREVGWQLYKSAGVAKGDREGSARQARENQRLFGAPHALLIHVHRELGTYGALDCGVYLGALLLAAESLGLGMIPQAALALHTDVLRELFAISDDSVFVVGASFGYPDEAHPVNKFRTLRAPLTESVTFVRS